MACFLVWLVSISDSWFLVTHYFKFQLVARGNVWYSTVHLLHHGSRLITVLVSAHINRFDKAKSFHDKMINFKLTLLSSIYRKQ